MPKQGLPTSIKITNANKKQQVEEGTSKQNTLNSTGQSNNGEYQYSWRKGQRVKKCKVVSNGNSFKWVDGTILDVVNNGFHDGNYCKLCVQVEFTAHDGSTRICNYYQRTTKNVEKHLFINKSLMTVDMTRELLNGDEPHKHIYDGIKSLVKRSPTAMEKFYIKK